MWKQSENNLKELGKANLRHHDDYGFFVNDITDAKGKVLLSWRVNLLRYMKEGELYKQFNLTEAWDSDHNKKLIEKMPKIFAPVRAKAEVGHMFYQGFTGENTFFQSGKKVRFGHVQNGIYNTALLVEAGQAVPWTKPEDISFDPKKDIPKLGAEFDGEFNMVTGTADVRKIKKDFDVPSMKTVIQISGNNGMADMSKILKK